MVTGVLHEDGQLFAVFSCGDAKRILPVELRDLVTFSAFRRIVASELDERVVYLRGRWLSDVLEAAERGGVHVEADDASRMLWLGSKQISYGDCGYVAGAMEAAS